MTSPSESPRPLGELYRSMLARLDGMAKDRHHRTGLRAYRVVVGLVLLFQILINYGQRGLLYGPEAAYPFDLFAANFGSTHMSALVFGDSVLGFELVYHICVLIIAAWTLGLATPITTPLTWLAVHTLHERCYALWDGGDNVTSLLLIYALFMDLSPRRSIAPGARWWTPYRNVLHNAGLAACILQICTVYFVAGLAKVSGKYWQNGTAFYYVLNSSEFGVTPLGPAIWDHPILLSILTWAPVLLQVAFPWVYLFGRPLVRRCIVLAAMSFHAGIFVLMGLESFAALMIAAELMLLSDADYRWFRRAGAEVWERIGRLGRPPPDRSDAPTEPGPASP